MTKKIMVVDDSNSIRAALKAILTEGGYDVIEAENGMEALELMKEHSIGLFISDVNMPVMDGIALLKRIKKESHHKHTPVLMLTTETDGDTINEGKEAGARAWMIKPFLPEQLLAAVKKLYA
jgi:two-component system chemotaxis response regulator CheY